MPEAVERIVLRCLAKDPADRFASMAELRDALRETQGAIDAQLTTRTIQPAAPALRPVEPLPATAPAPATIAPAAAPIRSAECGPCI